MHENAPRAKTNVEAMTMNASAIMPENAHMAPPTSDAIARLWSAIRNYIAASSPVPQRTARLMSAGEPKMAQKLIEEAGEVAVAAMAKDRSEVVQESADLLYHLAVLWARMGVRPEDVWAEMSKREATYGLAEKRAKARHRV